MDSPVASQLVAIDGLRAFVRDEFAAQRSAFEENIHRPLAERVERGTCLAPLTFLRVDETGRAVFSHAGNDSKLREGEPVRVSHVSAEGAPPPIRAWIYREEVETRAEGGTFWLVREERLRPAEFDRLPAQGWVVDQDFLDLEGVLLGAIERLAETRRGQERILPLLAGEVAPQLDEADFDVAMGELEAPASAWEESQAVAIAACVAADHCHLVQGPPGTGKTRVLAETVRRLVERGERVLVTAFTHRAIDHALGAVAREIADAERVARIAAPVHRRNEGFGRWENFVQSPLAAQKGGWAVGATPFALRKRLPGVEFDAVVIDEAGQMSAPVAILAMLAGDKYLLFGDQKQLGPVVTSRPRREIERAGIFQALRAQMTGGTTLEVTYRLNEELSRWPSENFYEGRLIPAISARARRLDWAAPPGSAAWCDEALRPEHPLVWVAGRDRRARTWNDEETSRAAELVRAAKRGGVPPEKMAVVTPYRRQSRLIRRRLETLAPGDSWRTCLIDTVERMQGQEREFILLSLCAADPDWIRWQAEFVFDPRRLNVAATRARTKLILLAGESLLETPLEDTELEEDRDLLRSLCGQARRIDPPEG